MFKNTTSSITHTHTHTPPPHFHLPCLLKASPCLLFQIDHYAQRDLKKGLQLFGTEGNVGLTNAWMIVQTDVSTALPATDCCLLTFEKFFILFTYLFDLFSGVKEISQNCAERLTI